MRKCEPGVICIENVTLFFIVILCSGFIYFIHQSSSKQIINRVSPQNINIIPQQDSLSRSDVLLNPYTPPLRDDGYFGSGRKVFNISTNIGSVNTNYRQVGILTPVSKNAIDDTSTNTILPLMGRPLYTNRDKWQFYTMTKHNIKLPIIRNGKSGTTEYGCDNIYSGDKIFVNGYNNAFSATIYDNDTIQYMPSSI
jgi:hypothetical protein